MTLGNNQLSDITAISGMNRLLRLHLFRNQLSDLSPIADKCSLTLLMAQQNQYSCPDPALTALAACGVPMFSDC